MLSLVNGFPACTVRAVQSGRPLGLAEHSHEKGNRIMVMIQHDKERALIYSEGGIGFEQHVLGIGWVVDDNPSAEIIRLAEHLQPAVIGQVEAVSG